MALEFRCLITVHVKWRHGEGGCKVLMAAFWFSGAKLQKFRLNPNVARSLRVKLDMSVFVETANGIDSSEHTLEKFLGAQLVFDTR
jgi:hypothetical protein